MSGRPADDPRSDRDVVLDDIRAAVTAMAQHDPAWSSVRDSVLRQPPGRPAVVIEYRGRAKDGSPRVGKAQVDDVAAFVEARYRAGWRELVVLRQGHEVGGITRHLDPGRSAWWSERGEDTP